MNTYRTPGGQPEPFGSEWMDDLIDLAEQEADENERQMRRLHGNRY